MLQPKIRPNVPVNSLKLPFVSEIDFDTVLSGDIINSHYPGVKFEAIPLPNTQGTIPHNVFASDAFDQTNADSPPNVITISQPPHGAAFNESGGAIRATFNSPQLYVSIDVRPLVQSAEHFNPDPGALPYLSAFGEPIILISPAEIVPKLGTMFFPLSNQDPQFTKSWRRIEFVSPSQTPNIYSVVFSCVYTGNGTSILALFDRFRFSPTLPLPATHFIG